jgi:hypothetical protein
MTSKTPIKVIKREERNRQSKDAAEAKASPQNPAREMVANVTSWVNEFHQKRRTETKQAIKTLFGEQPQPHEA